MWPLLVILACDGPRPEGAGVSHFQTAGPLRDAVFRGDLSAVRLLATELEGGETLGAGTEGADAEAALHAAVGFLIAAEDAAEAGEGLAAVARTCGDCHRARRVALPASPGGGEHHAALVESLWWSLLAGRGPAAEAALADLGRWALPDGDPIRTACHAPGEPLDRAQAAFAEAAARCEACHRSAVKRL